MDRLVELTEREYLDKKLDAAKEILSVLVSQYPPEFIIDKRKRGSIIFNSVSISAALIKEVGFIVKGDGPEKVEKELTAIRKLKDLLEEDDDK